MKKFFSATIVAMMAITATAQTKSDTLTVCTSPEMHCANCEKKIKQNIRFVKGTKKIETSVPNQTVTIVYDGTKGKYEDYAAAFKKIGYDIKKAEPKKETEKKK
ncbi:MAG: heavy-metal-associated domain-containing protein [Bacteroidales bacterium]|nr:heavy-metal-associated domain-containing protein [Bacteroidales bacterium]